MSIEKTDEVVQIPIDSAVIEGNLTVPKGSKGLVLFAHGAGSSRHSKRNNFVAEELQEGGLGTLLIDLLTTDEKEIDRRTRQIRFNIDLLSERVIGAIDWLQNDSQTQDLEVGVFGSSTGAAAALIAGAERDQWVEAIVSRGGRVDMAKAYLDRVKAPTLCIVGGRDRQVLSLNRQALDQLTVTRELQVVEGAGHLFEEPGALERVAELSRDWFQKYLKG
jgi:dienelactone hydrolase